MADFSEIIWGTPVHLLRSKINEVCAWKLIWRVVRLSTYSIFLITGLEPIFLAGQSPLLNRAHIFLMPPGPHPYIHIREKAFVPYLKKDKRKFIRPKKALQSRLNTHRSFLQILYPTLQSRGFSRSCHDFSASIVDKNGWKASVNFIVIFVDVIARPSDATCKNSFEIKARVSFSVFFVAQKPILSSGGFSTYHTTVVSYQDCPFGAFLRGETNSLWDDILRIAFFPSQEKTASNLQLNLNLICKNRED